MTRHWFLNTITVSCIVTTTVAVHSRNQAILSNTNLVLERHLNTKLLFNRHLNVLLTSNSKSSNSINSLLRSVRRGGNLNTRTRFFPRDHHDYFNHSSSFVEVFEEDTEEYEEEEDGLEYDEEEEEEDEIVEEEAQQQQQARPVVYRYFGRSRTRTRSDDSIPFILLGSNVDHWRHVGESLASLGFNVIACQRVLDKNSAIEDPITKCSVDGDEGPSLVQAVLDALRWPKAVIVGCDNDAITAIQAAIALDSQRRDGTSDGIVAGVILCGDLTQVERTIQQQQQAHYDHHKGNYYPTLSSRSPHYSSNNDDASSSSIDKFLKQNIPCPSMIIWEGLLDDNNKKHKRSTAHEVTYDEDLRTTILGGGLAPYRRLPDQFAWLLSRFVEEKVSSVNSHHTNHTITSTSSTSLSQQNIPSKSTSTWTFLQNNNEMIILSPGTLLVVGRVFATTILYMSTVSVVLYQYKKCKFIFSSLLKNAAKITIMQKHILKFVSRVLIDDWIRKINFLKRINFVSRRNNSNNNNHDNNINNFGNYTGSNDIIDDDFGLDDYNNVLYGIDSVMS